MVLVSFACDRSQAAQGNDDYDNEDDEIEALVQRLASRPIRFDDASGSVLPLSSLGAFEDDDDAQTDAQTETRPA